tara:strand:- start:612 stop:767 length:156 start_codon:yes stop_codon:yes gene_type:complete
VSKLFSKWDGEYYLPRINDSTGARGLVHEEVGVVVLEDGNWIHLHDDLCPI